jgi:23S rRNA pseudouridine2605 synthase
MAPQRDRKGAVRRAPRPSRHQPGRRPPARVPAEGGLERLQKVLAHAGLGSRRACEEFILQGRVTVDGQVVRELGTKVDPARQRIAVDGQAIHSERPVYYAVNKPKGYVSTNNDPAGRPRVIDLLPEIPERVFTVGRLDEASVGLMILTNDGELANRLAHPRFGVEKLYRAIVAGSPSQEVLDRLVEGVWLAEGKVRAKRAKIVGKQGDATIVEMVLAEGKNREVRRMLAKLGHKVMSLTRVRVGPITIKGLRPGESRRLTAEEVDRLKAVAAGIPDAGRAESGPRQRAGGPRRPSSRGTQAPAGPRRPGPSGARPPQHPPTTRRAAESEPRPPRSSTARRVIAPAETAARRPPIEPPAGSRKILGLPPEAAGRAARPGRRRPSGQQPRKPIIKRPRRPRPGSPPGAPSTGDES